MLTALVMSGLVMVKWTMSDFKTKAALVKLAKSYRMMVLLFLQPLILCGIIPCNYHVIHIDVNCQKFRKNAK
ncbi:hypothetical protein M569_00083 [Genlisea aurea]|uniref:Uncharacterized protein n=1 Tax=Genlisea aurea TaxID=192259 RepID=S8EF98_9LAMI|nr:hypothetical protein M569_00083 [Genlisea aurea]